MGRHDRIAGTDELSQCVIASLARNGFEACALNVPECELVADELDVERCGDSLTTRCPIGRIGV
jgi:hypothetical protein